MKLDYEVTTSSQAVQFLSRVFKHLSQTYDPYAPQHTAPAMGIVIDAQGHCLSAFLKEAA